MSAQDDLHLRERGPQQSQHAHLAEEQDCRGRVGAVQGREKIVGDRQHAGKIGAGVGLDVLDDRRRELVTPRPPRRVGQQVLPLVQLVPAVVEYQVGVGVLRQPEVFLEVANVVADPPRRPLALPEE